MDGDIDAAARDPTAIERPRRRPRSSITTPRSSAASTRRRSSWATRSAALITQILLDRGLGAAGVAIDSAPIKGVLRAAVSARCKSAFPALKNPTNNHRAVTLTPGGVPLRVHQHADRRGVAGGLRALRGARARAGRCSRPRSRTSTRTPRRKVDFHNDDRAPLLVIAGGDDHVSPVVDQPDEREAASASPKAITAYKEFPGRSHFTLGQAGWEEVADFALEWALNPRELEETTP